MTCVSKQFLKWMKGVEVLQKNAAEAANLPPPGRLMNEAPALTGHEAAYQHSENSVPDHEDMPRESGSVLVDPRDMLHIHGFPTSIEEWEKNQQLI